MRCPRYSHGEDKVLEDGAERLMKDLNLNLKERTEFFKKIGSSVAGEMSKALQNLTGEKLEVAFIGTQIFDEGRVFIDVEEKCFGSYMNFTSSSPPGGLLSNQARGVVVAGFPLSSTRTLTELLLKRYLNKSNRQTIDYEMKLSAFKEVVNILILTYISGLANTLRIELKMSVPKFTCFRNVEFMRRSLSRGYWKSDSLVSVGRFNICGGGDPALGSLLKGALLLFFSRTFKEENL